jgi:hypothetical protein
MKFSIFLTLLTITSLGAMAQNNFLPYSQFGIGDLDDGYYNRASGMAESGIAYRSNRFLINNNPASFSGLTNQYFTMEMGLRGSFIYYTGQPVTVAGNESGDITWRRLVLGIKASKHWGMSAGLVPFSTQNYEFNVPYEAQGSSTVVANSYFEGHGSVNKAYWANSYEFFNHLSLGVELGYIFGQLNQKNILQNSTTYATYTSTENDVDLQNLYVTYGMQLYGKLGKHWEYCLGGVYSQKARLLASPITIVLDNDSNVLQNEQFSETYLYLPNSYGGGLSLTHNHRYTWTAEYRYQDWNGVSHENIYPGQNYNIVSSERGSLGFEISKKRVFFNNLVELSYLQTGVYYTNSYLQINGYQIKDIGATFGFGVNSLKNPLSYNIIFQLGVKGTTRNQLIQQNYANVTFVLNFGSVWFTKGRKFD